MTSTWERVPFSQLNGCNLGSYWAVLQKKILPTFHQFHYVPVTTPVSPWSPIPPPPSLPQPLGKDSTNLVI